MASLIALSDHPAAKWVIWKSQTQPPPEMSTHSFRGVDAAQHPPAGDGTLWGGWNWLESGGASL